MTNPVTKVPDGYRAVTRKSPVPIYAIGAVWLAYAYLFPLYKISHFVIATLVSLAAYFILNSILPEKTIYEPDHTMTAATGDTAADELLRAMRQDLSAVRRAAEPMNTQIILTKIARLDMTCQKIIEYVMKNPSCAPQLRRFSSYYLPSLLKLVQTYADMEKAGVEGEHISISKEKIEKMLDVMAQAFDKQLDALFQNAALDISTDITVMESMLAQEGLALDKTIKEENGQDDQPFNLSL